MRRPCRPLSSQRRKRDMRSHRRPKTSQRIGIHDAPSLTRPSSGTKAAKERYHAGVHWDFGRFVCPHVCPRLPLPWDPSENVPPRQRAHCYVGPLTRPRGFGRRESDDSSGGDESPPGEGATEGNAGVVMRHHHGVNAVTTVYCMFGNSLGLCLGVVRLLPRPL